MRPVLWGLLGVVFCLPLAFVLYIVAAARYPAMDSFTMKLPAFVQTTVAELVLRNTNYGKDSAKGIDRTIKLDPESDDAWSRRCQFVTGDETRFNPATCRKAIALAPTPWNYNGLGIAQEHTKDYCAAEDSFTSAIRGSQNNAIFLRNMARAALRCGHTASSVAGFEVAEGLDAKATADPDEDEDIKANLLSDREYLIVAYDRTNQPAKAATICARAHAGWKSCHCELTETAVHCSNSPTPSASKK